MECVSLSVLVLACVLTQARFVRSGKRSFNGQSLHKLGSTPNPYETAIGIIGKTLAPFDEDNLIPCFGLRLRPMHVAATTHDYNVFSFHQDNSPCHGFEEVLACYRNVVPHLRLSGDL